MSFMSKYTIWSAVLVVFFLISGYFFLGPTSKPFSFGLDLVGGTELVYRADTSQVDDVSQAMISLKGVIERRVNLFGVSEPLVQTESAGIISGNNEERLIVELPGVTDIETAKQIIGETPVLEFRLARPDFETIVSQNPDASLDEIFLPAELTGRYLERARVEFGQTSNQPLINIQFNSDGKEIFSRLTREHTGEVLAIVLDGKLLSTPVIQEEIRDGQAQITGAFTTEDARNLVRDLNFGSLPVPIEFYTSQTVGATLGSEALIAGVYAGLVGFVVLSAFMILWYRVPGLISVLALISYAVMSLTIFKLIPVTLTAAGIAGFILSVGMAVDANVLIFERSKEEMKKGKSISESFQEGFHRAWASIRDSNTASIITAIILFWLGTSAVKGFALTLGIGVAVSMFTAITVSRTLLFAIVPSDKDRDISKLKKFVFGSGVIN